MFELRLAFALGRTLSELRASLNSEDYALYKAYELVEGFPSKRSEVGVALGCAAVARTWGGKFEPNDLLPDFRPNVVLDYKRGAEIFKAFALAHNQKRKNGKRHR